MGTDQIAPFGERRRKASLPHSPTEGAESTVRRAGRLPGGYVPGAFPVIVRGFDVNPVYSSMSTKPPSLISGSVTCRQSSCTQKDSSASSSGV